MNIQLSKQLLDCIKECILNIFWAKNDVVSFLEMSGSSKIDVLLLKRSSSQSTRKDLINIAFDRLKKRPDNGSLQFRAMINELIVWKSFDTYHFENGNLDREKARHWISLLRDLIDDCNSRIEQEKIKRWEKDAELRHSLTLNKLQNRFHSLIKGEDEEGKRITNQKRGYLFEDLLRDLSIYEGLATNECFKFNIEAEQIDGTIKFDGEHYIIEAKWQDALIASPSLYQFAYKVEGKLQGRGIFISLNGFSIESVRALKSGKSLSTILVDGTDLALIFDGIITFRETLDIKVKAAQTMGLIYVDASFKEKIAA